MNRYHRRCCRSPGWSAFISGTVLPRALDGIDLGPRVLELGPGYGASTRPLAARVRSLTVLEYDPLLAARLRAELGSVRVVHGDATSMGFGAGSFSAVVCFTMLHHLPGAAAQDRLFAEAARVLRPGGVFAGTDSRPSLRWRLVHLGDVCTPSIRARCSAGWKQPGSPGLPWTRTSGWFVSPPTGPARKERPGPARKERPGPARKERPGPARQHDRGRRGRSGRTWHVTAGRPTVKGPGNTTAGLAVPRIPPGGVACRLAAYGLPSG